jgi:hypothetical protein
MNDLQDLYIRVLLIIDVARTSITIRWLKETRDFIINCCLHYRELSPIIFSNKEYKS